MKIDIVSIILIAAFIVPIIRGYVLGFSSNSLKQDILSVEGDVNFIVSVILGLYFMRKIFVQHDLGVYSKIYHSIPNEIITYIEGHPNSIYIIVLPIIAILVYQLLRLIFYIFNIIIIFPILDSIDKVLRGKSVQIKKVIASIFQLPKAICYVVLLSVLLYISAYMNVSKVLESQLSRSTIYSYMCKNVLTPIVNSKLAKQIPGIINNSFRIEVRQASSENAETNDSANGSTIPKGTIVYYNGITLDEGVRSDDAINEFAKKLVAGENNDLDKAKRIYDWVGKNISYDYDKANRILDNDLNEKSGAIVAFEQRRGICFDYACLYVAMCRAAGLHVRLITGEGFNGMNWVGHAWNQVEVQGNWINVDTTFYKGGNYFNTKRFNLDHRSSEIAGQW